MEKNAGTLTDQSLIERCQSGDKTAFELLVSRYYQKSYSMAFMWVNNRDTALDISQEAFVRVYRHLSGIDAKQSFGAWLYTIVRNLCRNHNTRHRYRWSVFTDMGRPGQGGDDYAAVLPELADGSENLEVAERQMLLKKELNRLPKRDKEIILLKDIEEFSYKEIAEVLGIPIGTVMSRLYHARKKLAQRLAGVFDD